MISWLINLTKSNKIAFSGVFVTFILGLATLYQKYTEEEKSNGASVKIEQQFKNTENIQQTFGNNSPINNQEK